MALERKDNVKDQTTTAGTGTFTVGGIAPVGFRTVASAHTDGATVRYKALINAEWEVGEGIWSVAGNTLTRVTIFASSNAGNLVNFSAGTKVLITTPTAADFSKSSLYAFAAAYG